MITDGFARNEFGKGIAGAVVVAVVALVLELAAAAAQRVLDPVPRAPRTKRGTGMSGGGPSVAASDAESVGA